MREFAIEVLRALLMPISGSFRFVTNRAWIRQVAVLIYSESSDQCLTICSEKAKSSLNWTCRLFSKVRLGV